MKEKQFKSLKKKDYMPEITDNSAESTVKLENHHDVLMEAKAAWDSLYDFRENRNRCRNYTFGRQWEDVITTPEGETMSEENYLIKQGKPPLKNNIIRSLIKNVVGQFRIIELNPVCISRDRDEQHLSEMMSVAVQYAHQLNKLSDLDGRTFEEFLISGCCFHRVEHGWKEGKMDVWVEQVNPNRMFFNAMEDFRHWDCTMIGQIHDMTKIEVLSRFAKGSQKRAAKIKEHYATITSDLIGNMVENLNTDRIENIDFLTPSQTNLCRVIEVWQLESKERLKCHDMMKGEYYKIELSQKKEIETENQNRIKMAAKEGIDPKDVALIETEWFIDRFWSYRFLTPMGDLLDGGETPYWHGSHPYAFKLFPLIDGQVHSFIEDIIDQQRYINRLITMIDFIMSSSAKGVLLFPESQIPDNMTVDDLVQEWSSYNGVILYRDKPGGGVPQQISTNATNIGAFELLQLQIGLLNDISGVSAAMQGQTPLSGTSGSLYAQQVKNSSNNLTDVFESYKAFRLDRDTKIMKTIQQYYTQPRYLKIAGKFSQGIVYTPDQVLNAEFDISLSETSGLPAYREKINEMLLTLFGSGKVDLETLLKLGAVPFADQMLRELRIQDANEQAKQTAASVKAMDTSFKKTLQPQDNRRQEKNLLQGLYQQGQLNGLQAQEEILAQIQSKE